jgi:hypothetical protein
LGWITLDKLGIGWIVISGVQVVEAGLAIQVLTGKPEGIRDATGAGGNVPIGIEGVGRLAPAAAVCNKSGAAELVVVQPKHGRPADLLERKPTGTVKVSS